ncbi:MAG: dTDP-4-dehydrorhamnose reductase [Omnitrophica bacterium RIFCSPHIGHO2_02_FULL_63_14]|nr:MAG: dTDP-4-dehydrorhamnose reductase [Omnitrophica bacterium RIFCSPHIGHO2_02_FULL_63_14]
MRKILVTGAGGMVGSYVSEVFSDYELILSDIVKGHPRVDVCQPAAVMDAVASAKPDVVLHLAAATDVDRCEQEPAIAFQTNAIGTQNVALACQATGAVLVYISTAGVFWGDKLDPYVEFDTPNPANIYGQSKLAGEQIVTSLLQRFYIVRAGWMAGGGERDKKFVGKITKLILDGVNPLRVVNDKWGSPTYAKDLLTGIRRLLETGYYGLYHMANHGCCSRYDVALMIREVLERPEIDVAPVSSAFFPLPAPRARSEAMRNFKLELLGLDAMRTWQEALREYLQTELMPILSASQAV